MNHTNLLRPSTGIALALALLLARSPPLPVTAQVSPSGHHQLPANPHVTVFKAATTATALNGPGGSVSIRADGTVKVTGTDRNERLVKLRVSRSYLRYLLREFEDLGFFSLPDQISGTGIIADAPQETLSVQTRTEGRTVTETVTTTPAPQAHLFDFLSRLVGEAAGMKVYP